MWKNLNTKLEPNVVGDLKAGKILRSTEIKFEVAESKLSLLLNNNIMHVEKYNYEVATVYLSLLNRVLDLLSYLRTCVLRVLVCLRAHVLGVFPWLRLARLTCLRAYVSTCFKHACLLFVLSAHMSYMFVVLKQLSCLRVCILGVLVFPICFTFEKLNSKNSCTEKFVVIQTNI